MKKLITAFFMAWGNFITIPCPYKHWDGQLKNMMLAFLPSVGAVVGALWVLLAAAVVKIGLHPLLSALVLMFYIFRVSGYMHLDGFMDCNDAILSRRPLEERQRIMKDPAVGSFAAVTLVFLLIGWGMIMGILCSGKDFLCLSALFYVPVFSRSFSGMDVLRYKPIGHSQYVETYSEAKGKYYVASLLQVILWAAAGCGIVQMLAGMGMEFLTEAVFLYLVSFVVSGAACRYARKQLGGMSGDIAGYVICITEFCEVLALSLIPESGIFALFLN